MKSYFGFVLILMLFGCGQNTPPEEAVTSSPPPPKDDAYLVNTSPARQQTLAYPIQTQGKVEARKHIPITFEVSGLLEAIHISNATYVKKGQLIATLQREEQRIDLVEAELNYEKVLVDFENQMASYGDSTDNPAHWATIEKNIGLLAGLPTAKIALERARLNLDKTEFRAPFAGLIEGWEMKVGQSVQAMQPVGRIIDRSSLEVLCNVLEFDLGKLGIGDSAAIFPLAYPSEKLLASVREINPKVEATGYVKVRLAIDAQHNLLDGMSCRVEIYVPESRQILVPKSAIVKKSGRDVVFTVEESLAKWNYVTLGKENGRQVAILEGLEPDVEVITSNNLQLAHDSPVRVTSRNPSP